MMDRTNQLVLVRHGDVDSAWKGVCYGQRDVELCDKWKKNASPLIAALTSLSPTKVYHSGLSRTRWLAEQVVAPMRDGAQSNSPAERLIEDQRLRERHFGDWEGLSWDDAYASDPENFHHLIHRPDSYRPPGGETTNEMQQRVVCWYQSLPLKEGVIIAIAHSGTIAALAGHLLKLPATDWQDWMLKTGEAVVIERSCDSQSPISVQRGLP